jgi:hypothetical protein
MKPILLYLLFMVYFLGALQININWFKESKQSFKIELQEKDNKSSEEKELEEFEKMSKHLVAIHSTSKYDYLSIKFQNKFPLSINIPAHPVISIIGLPPNA